MQDPVTWYGINYAGTQMEQWDFQNKGKSGWAGKSSFLFEVPLRQLRPCVFNSVPCDWILHIELSLKGLVYVLRQNFLLWAACLKKKAWDWPTLSCLSKCVKDLWKLTADQLGPNFFWVSLDALSSYSYRNPSLKHERKLSQCFWILKFSTLKYFLESWNLDQSDAKC